RLAAELLNMKFVDVDDYIEKKEGKTIKKIFEQNGEWLFRKLEKEAVKELCESDNMVLAPGGGAVMIEENTANLKHNGFVVLLETDAETIHSRLKLDTDRLTQRPDLTDKDPLEEIKHMLEIRKPVYQSAADIKIDTSSTSIEEISKIVVAEFKNKMGNKPKKWGSGGQG
ncbi:MAG: shikimate kinase, partial [Bacteroidota bacterium]